MALLKPSHALRVVFVGIVGTWIACADEPPVGPTPLPKAVTNADVSQASEHPTAWNIAAYTLSAAQWEDNHGTAEGTYIVDLYPSQGLPPQGWHENVTEQAVSIPDIGFSVRVTKDNVDTAVDYRPFEVVAVPAIDAPWGTDAPSPGTIQVKFRPIASVLGGGTESAQPTPEQELWNAIFGLQDQWNSLYLWGFYFDVLANTKSLDKDARDKALQDLRRRAEQRVRSSNVNVLYSAISRMEGPYIISGPTITSEPSVDSDGDGTMDTYVPTGSIRIEVVVSELICGSGYIALTLQTGSGLTVVRNADYASCGGFDVHKVSFEYRVTEDDMDGDGVSIAANAIRLETSSGVINLSHEAVPSQPNHRVDGSLMDNVQPELRGVPHIRSSPADGDTFRRGEIIWVAAIFKEPVIVNTAGGPPTLPIEIGSQIRRAQYHSTASNDPNLLWFSYTVQADDLDDDGTVWVPSREGFVIPEGSSIRDSAGNDADVSSWRVSQGDPVKVDGGGDLGGPYIITGLRIISEPSVDSDGDGTMDTYVPSSYIVIVVDFSPKEGLGDLILRASNYIELTLQTGSGLATVRKAVVRSWANSRSAVFEYQVTADDMDSDGVSIAADAIRIRGLDLSHAAVPAQPNHRVDGSLMDNVPPELDLGISATQEDGDTFRRGETIWLYADSNEPVIVNTAGGPPILSIEIGSQIRRAQYHSTDSNDPKRLWFSYTVQADDLDDDGVVVSGSEALVIPEGSSIRDSAGNDAVLPAFILQGGLRFTNAKVDGRTE